MATKRKPTAWLELFDTAEMDHVCEAVRVNVVNVSLGEPSNMHIPLRRWLLAPIRAYLSDHWEAGKYHIHVKAAERFNDAVETLAERFEDRYPFGADEGETWATHLRFAWLEFIAYGAGHRMYHDIPRTSWRTSKSAQHSRNGWPSLLTSEDVVAVMNATPTPTKYEAVIAELCERAKEKVPSGCEPPKGEPDSAATRQYRMAVSAGKVKALSQRR